MGTERHGRSHARGRKNARKRRKSRSPAYAAIDLGTNSCRMLIAREAQGGFTVVDGFSRIVRLGEGLVRSGSLHEAARARTLAALQICRDKIDHHDARRIRCVATAACREADNSEEFIRQIADATGLTLETISAMEEAGLTVSGCSPLLASGYPRGILFDIGGGSTEIMWLDTRGSGSPNILDMV